MKTEQKSYKTIYVLGNPIFEKDSLPIKLLPKLKKEFPEINFQHIDPTENLPEQENLIIIDTVINANQIKILKDPDKIQSSPTCSLHDFDLGFQLKLMKKLGKIKDITIIGIPENMNEEKILKQIKPEIEKCHK